MALTLYRNGSIYSSADPFATAMMIDGNTVAWIGGEEAADRQAERADEVIDLEGGLVTPAFVDSHTHLADLGAVLAGEDLSAGRSPEDLVARLRELAGATEGQIITAHGWDETRWATGQLPATEQLEAAAGGKGYYLTRIDKHSALVNQRLLELLQLKDITPGLVHGAERDKIAAALDADPARVSAHQRRALEHYASRGFAVVVEMAAEHLGGKPALKALLAEDDPQLPEVYAYWGQAVSGADEARALADEFDSPRLLGLGGDLKVDGSLGSRSAALREDYADAPGERGTLFLEPEQIAAHLVACSETNTQAGFHVIGDAALDTVLAGFDLAAERIGVARLQAGRHRLEHAEMVDEASRQRLLAYSITVSMQPRFDEYWGAEHGMYRQRLGERAGQMNNLAAMLSAGVPVVLGSDAPVTEVDGWATVRAAMRLNQPAGRISARAAFLAQTRSAYRAMGQASPYTGQLVIGAPATFAVWSASELAVQTPDERISSWSTDARAGTPLLPVIDEQIPECLRTVRAGITLFDALPVRS